MRIFVSNFARRAGDWLQANHNRLIKWLVIAAAAILAFLLIRYAVEEWQRSRYEKRIEMLERQIFDADAKAQAAEARAGAIQAALELKYAELRDLGARAANAEKNMRQTRTVYLPLKEKYEQARDNPMPIADLSCADLCAELAGLGHPCR